MENSAQCSTVGNQKGNLAKLGIQCGWLLVLIEMSKLARYLCTGLVSQWSALHFPAIKNTFACIYFTIVTILCCSELSLILSFMICHYCLCMNMNLSHCTSENDILKHLLTYTMYIDIIVTSPFYGDIKIRLFSWQFHKVQKHVLHPSISTYKNKHSVSSIGSRHPPSRVWVTLK